MRWRLESDLGAFDARVRPLLEAHIESNVVATVLSVPVPGRNEAAGDTATLRIEPTRSSVTSARLSSTLVGVSRWFDELSDWLRIRSVSADAARAGDVRDAGEWVCQFLRAAGGEAELVDWQGQPLAIGELRA
ncbi:MAG: hypothetical protein ACRDPM_26010, partial [Solirubrobacteraceae bacterium]